MTGGGDADANPGADPDADPDADADVTVRDATPTDADGVRRVGRRAWAAAYEGLLAPSTVEAAVEEWYAVDTLREGIGREAGTFLVATADGVAGYVVGTPVEGTDAAVLAAINVDPDWWGRGVGTALLGAFEARCRDWGRSVVRVRALAGNEVGLGFYRARGYRVVGSAETVLFGEPVVERVIRGRLDRDE